MELTYKTRAGATPQGKPKVYFTAHPLDAFLYWEKTAGEILSRQNCAVFCKKDPAAQPEDLSILERMNLFAIPVTARFLTEPNWALQREFVFAMERHIPVLMLADENLPNDMQRLFNEKCRELQILVRKDCYVSDVSYEEKLDKFLSSVLVGDSLADEIRNAFDAYIFLSYRKKDREHIGQLMKAIHANDFCRDIAIWYDEFLVPGQNFNDSIKEALDKSSLVTLVVTPNMVNEPNYVVSTEYPMARSAGKPIIPVEAVHTDEGLLKNSFAALPNCIDICNTAALTQALQREMAKLNIQGNDNSPEHNFLIGMAYLSGVDVEADRAKGLEMITGAAEGGSVRAMEKLVEMYRSGDGVSRNYRTALCWQQRLTEALGKKYRESRSLPDGIKLFNGLRIQGDFFWEQRDVAAAESAYLQMERVAEELTARFGLAGAGRCLSSAYSLVGDIYQAKGDFADAQGQFEEGLALSVRLLGADDSVELMSDILLFHERLGTLCLSQGDYAGALGHYQKSREMSRLLYEELQTAAVKRSFAVACEKLADIFLELGDFDQSEAAYQQSLKLFKELLMEQQDLQSRASVANSCMKVGDFYRFKGDLALAERFYREGAALREKLHEEQHTVESKDRLSFAYTRVGLACLEQKRMDEAKSWCRKGFMLARETVEEAETRTSLTNLSVSCNRMGQVCLAEEDYAGAEQYFLEDLRISEKLYQKSSAATDKNNVAVTCGHLGNVYEKMGDNVRANIFRQRCAGMFRDLDALLSTSKSRGTLASALYNISRTAPEEEGRPAILEAYRIWAELAEKEPSSANLRQRDLILSQIWF